jgi:KUP system potassium uptake protein
MMTWKLGRRLLGERIAADSLPLEAFLEDIDRTNPHRVAGTAVFLTSIRRGTPAVLLHHFKHNKVLHQQVVILSIVTDAVPEVAPADFVNIKFFDRGFWAVTAHYGFMQTPDVVRVLRACASQGLYLNEAETSFYLGRETLLTGKGRGMSPWRKRLFRFLSRNARSATDFFSIPPNRVVEIGTQIEL